MLEVLYDIDTLEVLAWNADPLAVGLFTPTAGQGVVIFPEEPPSTYAEVYFVDLDNPGIYPDPDYVPPPDPPDLPAMIADLQVRILVLEASAE